ncbi:MAG: phosphoribosyltransferase [Candidatus Woesearchaeota archaeon]
MSLIEQVVMDYFEKKEEIQFSKKYIDFEREVKHLNEQLIKLLENKKLNEYARATKIYFALPYLICTALNYKITVEHGLVMHNTRYVNLNDKCCEYSLDEKKDAHKYFMNTIKFSKDILMQTHKIQELKEHLNAAPNKIQNFKYTSDFDYYTYLAAHPHRIKKLSDKIKKEIKEPHIIGTAHGAILPGLVLSNILKCNCYFIRHSQYKRLDNAPIMHSSDINEIKGNAQKEIILLDEDLSTGTTIINLREEIKKITNKTPKLAGVIYMQTSKIKPDFYSEYHRL